MNMDFKRKLAIPMEVKEMYPLTGGISKIKEERDAQIREIFEGKDDRMLLIIGPCSADNEDSVLDYMTRLAKLQEKVKDKILMVPRVYTNKPRTTGEGYKGLLHQPDPEGNPDMFKGIIATRELHMKVVKETGFTCADEMLYPESYKYIDDILSYVAVGARSVENQQHRLTASGMDVPAGMKNPTSGDLSVMMNSIYAAQHSHTFIYRGWEATSQGNPFAHAILRGYTNSKGEHHPNYHYEDIILLCDAYDKRELKNPACIIDCNHENSGKNPFEQPRIIKEVLSNCNYNKRIKDMVKGFMVESYIEDGNQKIGEGVYGKSITDACLGWEKSEKLVLDMAEML
ncbi:MAG: 3-deoxy-7-phosphoheptulonate synthase [Lachnospiraceae bacterium]|nr:3-deoxy-7-phosphoheptulonate synthase [Lachnospiraceae bacterium]